MDMKDEAKRRYNSARNSFDELIGYSPIPSKLETTQNSISQTLIAIAATLIDIRDELRKMNEGSDNNGKT